MTASTETNRKDAMLALLEKARLTTEESSLRVDHARDEEYWRALNPQLGVERTSAVPDLQDRNIDPTAADSAIDSFRQHGWFDAGVVLEPGATDRLRSALEVVRENGWPEVFAFAYDEFWLAPRIPHLSRIIQGVLGPGYRQLPHIWGHFVPPGSRGWRPHVDGAATDRLTVWIGLNDAGVDNACMCLVPADRAPASIVDNFTSFTSATREETLDLLRHARALPTRAGSALSWHQRVIHWGSASYQRSGSRISFSQEFIARDATPEKHELPLISVDGALPSLKERLHFIATAVLAYARFEPLMGRYTTVANALLLH